MKYKVGDKVRVIGNRYKEIVHSFEDGDLVVVFRRDLSDKTFLCIRLSDELEQWVHIDNLEPEHDYPKWMEVRDEGYQKFHRKYVIGECKGRYITADFENYEEEYTWLSYKEARDIEEEKTIP